MKISAFGDEIAADLKTQLTLLNELDVHYLELRAAWGINVADFTHDDVLRVKTLCAEHNISVSALGSPVGKTPITDPLETEAERLRHLFTIGEALDTRHIRVFAFYPPPHEAPAAHVVASVDRLGTLTDIAVKAGFMLLLENDHGLVGDTIERTHAVLSGVNSPNLRHAWDGANFSHAGEATPTTTGWPLLKDFLGTVHVKDWRLADGSRRAAGEGDSQMADLLKAVDEIGYDGYYAVEPHPYLVDGRGEIHGEEGMRYAVGALRKLM